MLMDMTKDSDVETRVLSPSEVLREGAVTPQALLAGNVRLEFELVVVHAAHESPAEQGRSSKPDELADVAEG